MNDGFFPGENGTGAGASNNGGYQADADNLVLDLTDVDENKGFELMPKGEYDAIVDNIEYGYSNSSGNAMLTWTFKVAGGDFDNRKLFWYTVLSTDMGKAQLKKALLRICPNIDMSKFNPKVFAETGEPIGLPCKLKVGIQKAKPGSGYSDKNSVQDILPLSGGSFLP